MDEIEYVEYKGVMISREEYEKIKKKQNYFGFFKDELICFDIIMILLMVIILSSALWCVLTVISLMQDV